MSAFGQILRELRTQRGWSQVGLAHATDGRVSPTLVSLIERGQRGPSHDSVDALADALTVSGRVRAEMHAARKEDRNAPVRGAAPAGPRRPDTDVVSLAGLSPEQKHRVRGYVDAMRQG